MILVLDTAELQSHMQLQLPGYGFTNISRMLLLRPFANLIVRPWELVDAAGIEPAMDV